MTHHVTAQKKTATARWGGPSLWAAWACTCRAIKAGARAVQASGGLSLVGPREGRGPVALLALLPKEPPSGLKLPLMLLFAAFTDLRPPCMLLFYAFMGLGLPLMLLF